MRLSLVPISWPIAISIALGCSPSYRIYVDVPTDSPAVFVRISTGPGYVADVLPLDLGQVAMAVSGGSPFDGFVELLGADCTVINTVEVSEPYWV